MLLAPTGSGKTLAAFLSAIDSLMSGAPDGLGVKVLYVSPLTALVYDVERNLRAPLGPQSKTFSMTPRSRSSLTTRLLSKVAGRSIRALGGTST